MERKKSVLLTCRTLLLAAAGIGITGCSSTYSVSAAGAPNAEYSYHEVHQHVREREAEIELRNGSTLIVSSVIVTDETVSWTDLQTGRQSAAHADSIQSITVASTFLGILEGLGFGLTAGIVIGGGIGTLSAGEGELSGTNTGITKRTIGMIVGAALGGLTGLAAGGSMGGVIGHRYIYKFSNSKNSRRK